MHKNIHSIHTYAHTLMQTNLHMFPPNSTPAQKWKLVPVKVDLPKGATAPAQSKLFGAKQTGMCDVCLFVFLCVYMYVQCVSLRHSSCLAPKKLVCVICVCMCIYVYAVCVPAPTNWRTYPFFLVFACFCLFVCMCMYL